MGLNKSKKKISILRRIVYLSLVLSLILSSLFLMIMLNSGSIGDWYYKQDDTKKSVIWYEYNYSFRKSEDALLKLCYGLFTTNDFSRIYKYYEKVINNQQINLESELRVSYIADYIESSYYFEGIEKYKELYSKYVYELKDSSKVYFPLETIAFDPRITQEDLRWEIEFTDRLLQLIVEPKVKLGVYGYQIIAYERIGNVEKVNEINAIYEKMRNDILNGK